MSNEEIMKWLEDMLFLLRRNLVVKDEHVDAVDAVEVLIENERAAWEMLDELKRSEDFGKAFGSFMADLMGTKEVVEA